MKVGWQDRELQGNLPEVAPGQRTQEVPTKDAGFAYRTTFLYAARPFQRTPFEITQEIHLYDA